jgi:hypothetical protein
MSTLHVIPAQASLFEDLVNSIDWETKRKNNNWLEIFHSMTDDNPTVIKFGYQHPEKTLQLHAFRSNEYSHYGTLLGIFNTQTNMYEGIAHASHVHEKRNEKDKYPRNPNWKKQWNTVLLNKKPQHMGNPLQVWRDNFTPSIPSLKPSILEQNPLWNSLFQDIAETWIFHRVEHARIQKLYDRLDDAGKFFVLQSLDTNSKNISLASQVTLATLAYHWMYFPETRPTTCMVSDMYMGDRMILYIDSSFDEPVRCAFAITDYTNLPSMFNNIRPMFIERFENPSQDRLTELLNLMERTPAPTLSNPEWNVKVQALEDFPKIHALDIQTPDTDTAWALRYYANMQKHYIKQYNEAVDIANQLYPEYQGRIRQINGFNDHVVHPVPWTMWLHSITPQKALDPDNNALEYLSADTLS